MTGCDTEQTSNVLDVLFGLSQHTQNQALFLFLVCFIILLVQLLVIGFYWCSCPRIVWGIQTFDTTKKNFKALVRSVLTLDKHHIVLLGDWLVVETINASNYKEDDREKLWKEFHSPQDIEALLDIDGRKPSMIKIDTRKWIVEEMMENFEGLEVKDNTEDTFQSIINSIKESGLPEMKSKKIRGPKVTPMMKLLNYHLKIIDLTSDIGRYNFGITFSKKTERRKDQLPFRGSFDPLLKMVDVPPFPTALEYSVIRNIKNAEDWDYHEKGIQINPIILSEQPWTMLKQVARSYLFSLAIDLVMYWVQAVISVILLNVIFSP